MAIFKIEEIDRAIEWLIKDKVIAKGFWPAQRVFIKNDDELGFQEALDALQTKIEIFSVGSYQDREQLKRNNLIIDRMPISPGDVGASWPWRYDLQADNTYTRKRTAEGTNNIEYEIRFVCDDIALDRAINLIMLNALNMRAHLKGVLDDEDLTETAEGFDVFQLGGGIDLSGAEFIERLWRYTVSNVNIQEEIDDTVGIPPVKEVGITSDPGGAADTVTLPLVTAGSIEPGTPAVIDLTFDQIVTAPAAPEDLNLPFSILVDNVAKTDINSIATDAAQTKLSITFASTFVTGEVVTVSYDRGLGGEVVANKKLIEMTKLQSLAITNNL